jgi:hypothetical protein
LKQEVKKAKFVIPTSSFNIHRSSFNLAQHLLRIHPPIQSLLPDQFLVPAGLNDPAIVQNKNPVGTNHRG